VPIRVGRVEAAAPAHLLLLADRATPTRQALARGRDVVDRET
jgi:hypothetical protein